MIRVNVSLADASVTEKETLTAGRVGLECAFSFSSDWDGLQKIAVFEGAEKCDVALLNTDTAVVPPECLSVAGYKLTAGVYGMNDAGDIVIPTVLVAVGKILESAEPSGVTPPAPAPSWAAQVQEAAAEALEKATAVEDAAERGDFDGADGADGADGQDGVSPEVTIAEITGGHSVTITDAEHPSGQSFDVMDGQDGGGVPSGGTAGQVLKKASATDFDTVWANESGGGGGGGAVESVNGQTGVVVLSASDVGALPSDADLDDIPDGTTYKRATAAQLAQIAENAADIDALESEVDTKADAILVTASGAVASFSDGGDGLPVKNLIVAITAQQSGSGDPSLSNVRTITGWTGLTLNHSGADTSDPETLTVSWESEAGTVYGGTLNLTTGVLTVEYARYPLSSFTWGKKGSPSNSFATTDGIPADWPDSPDGTSAIDAISDVFIAVAYGTLNNAQSPIDHCMSYRIGTVNRGLAIKSSALASVYSNFTNEALQQALSGHYVVYRKATPQTYQLTAHEIDTLLGVNQIWANCGGVSVTYRADTTLYVDRPDAVTVNQATGDDLTGNPYRSIEAALASGAKRITLAADYYGAFTLDRPCVLDGDGHTVYGDTPLTTESYNSIRRAPYTADALITACFVDQTTDLTEEVPGSSWKGPKYNIACYCDDQKLLPVASVALCEATENSFTWYDGYFYLNSSGSRCAYVTETACFIATDCTVTELKIRHLMGSVQVTDGSVEIINSSVIGSVNNSCIIGQSCDLVLRNVETALCWNDGVNVHSTGNCVLYDCYCHDCSDDGVSHHDYATGAVYGGEFCRCGKGGIASPVNASKVEIYGAYCHDNDYGIYATASSSGYAPQTYNVWGCVLTGNRIGIFNGYHTVRLYGNRIYGNTTDKSNQSGGTMTELDASTVTSVNSKTGAVTLNASDVGALPASTKYAASQSAGGAADKAVSIPMGTVDDTSTSTAFTATVSGITELRDGVCVWLTNGVVTSAAGCTLDINSLGAKPIYNSIAAATATTTAFNINYTMLFIYNSSRVTGGCWDIVYGYDSNTTYTLPKLGCGYTTCSTAAATAAKTASLSSYALTTGGYLMVKFTNAVGAGATLNVASKGAKALYYQGAAITDGVINAGDTVLLCYSTQYHVVAIDRWGADIAAKYTKPTGGIPASDLASAVQTSLGKADTALQSAPVTSVNGQTGAVTLSASDVGAQAAPNAVTQSAPTAITLADNTEYYLTNVGSLTLTYPNATHWECWLKLTTASSGTITVTLPTSTYIGSAPTFGNSQTWEISIRDGVVVAGKVAS